MNEAYSAQRGRQNYGAQKQATLYYKHFGHKTPGIDWSG